MQAYHLAQLSQMPKQFKQKIKQLKTKNKMETTFKKILYAGIGLASEASEKIEKRVNELAKKGETSDTEVKKIVDDFIKRTDETSKKVEKKFNEIAEKFGYAKNSEVAELRKKLETLETLAAEKNKTVATVKK